MTNTTTATRTAKRELCSTRSFWIGAPLFEESVEEPPWLNPVVVAPPFEELLPLPPLELLELPELPGVFPVPPWLAGTVSEELAVLALPVAVDVPVLAPIVMLVPVAPNEDNTVSLLVISIELLSPLLSV